MLYYVVEAVTRGDVKRLVSFSDIKDADRYANHLINISPNSFWIGVVDQDEWYSSFA